MKKTIKIAIFTILSFFLLTTTFVIGEQFKENLVTETAEVQKQSIDKYNYDPNLPMDGVVDFADEDFKILLNKQYFGQPDNHEITREQMESLDEIKINGSIYGDNQYDVGDIGFIEDINGIQYASNLTTFSYKYGVDYFDLDPLKDLVNLKYLTLAYSGVEDLTPLANLKNLEYLYIINRDNTTITNYNVIENFQSLKHLEIKNNKKNKTENIMDYIDDLKNLEYVSIQGFRQIESPDKYLASSDKIKYFNITGSNISDLEFIKQFTNVEYLYIRDSIVQDIPDLSSLNNLVYLDLSANMIYDFSTLVNISDSVITSLSNQTIIVNDKIEHDKPIEFYIILPNGEKQKVDFGEEMFIGSHKYYGEFENGKQGPSGMVVYDYNWNGTWIDSDKPAIEIPTNDINWGNVILIVLISIIATVFLAICIV